MIDPGRRFFLKVLSALPLSFSVDLFADNEGDIDRNKIIAVEWLPMELLFILGVKPIGVTDPVNYMSMVQQPPIPEGCADVGLRTEPNLEFITTLNPELIVYSSGYGPKPSVLESIAPTFPVYFNDGRGRPLTTTTNSLLSLAKKIGREPEAIHHISLLDKYFNEIKVNLSSHVRRPLLLMSFVDERHAMIFGEGSLFNEVLERLNIQNAWNGSTNFWGSTIIGIESLSSFKDVNVICLSDNDEVFYRKLLSSPIWSAMPFIRERLFFRVPVIWFYGGTLTAVRFGQVINKVLSSV